MTLSIPGKNTREQISYLRAGGRTVYPGGGASSRVANQPPVDAECARLIAAANGAMHEVDKARADGRPSAIAAAETALREVKAQLEKAQITALQKAAVSAVLRAPIRMMR